MLWILNGGYSDQSSGTKSTAPSTLVGVVGDDVRALSLRINDTTAPIDIRNNSFSYQLSEPSSDAPWLMTLQVTYVNGTVAATDIPDPRPNS